MKQKVLGDYNIIKTIGHGPLGTVYLAEHRFMKKQYAVKVLSEDLSSDRGFIQRFEEDVRQLATLEHPNLVKIHNISFSDGKYFIVMDCIVDELGETTNALQYLSTLENGFKEADLKSVLTQIASALDYLHSKQVADRHIIHRGIKLNNILISKKGGEIRAYLSDAGLTRIIGTKKMLSKTYKVLADSLGQQDLISGEASYDNVGNEKFDRLQSSFLQNFYFLAPEQKASSDKASITASADVYAFGILTYYLIMHEFPEGIFEMPSVGYPAYNLNWDALIVKCLRRDPLSRPPKLVDALESLLNKTSGESKNTQNIEVKKSTFEGKTISTEELVKMRCGNDKEETLSKCSNSDGSVVEREPALKPILKKSEAEFPKYDPDPASAFKIDPSVTHYVPAPVYKQQIEPLHTDMVIIQGGEFSRGSDDGNRDENPRHNIFIDSFAMDIHQVSNEQFIRFLEFMGGEKNGNNKDLIRLRESRIKRSAGNLNIESGYNKHPVVGVTWYGAVAYAKWVGKRLPTEAEWEVAAKAGDDHSIYSVDGDIEKSKANYFSSDTTAVMSYLSNGSGLYDMAGNVYEWCQDWYDYNYYEVSKQEPENPTGPLQGVYRVLRGGCWKSLQEDLRCSHRHRNNPGTVNKTYGFRCASGVE